MNWEKVEDQGWERGLLTFSLGLSTERAIPAVEDQMCQVLHVDGSRGVTASTLYPYYLTFSLSLGVWHSGSLSHIFRGPSNAETLVDCPVG